MPLYVLYAKKKKLLEVIVSEIPQHVPVRERDTDNDVLVGSGGSPDNVQKIMLHYVAWNFTSYDGTKTKINNNIRSTT